MESCSTPAGLNTGSADRPLDWRAVAAGLESSYKINNYGALLYGLVCAVRPQTCVEIGVLHGYSSLHIGAALRDNDHGHLCCYDLWESYPFHHTRMADVQETIDAVGLADWISLHQCDAMHVPAQIKSLVDFLHVDISNDGGVYHWATYAFRSVMADTGLIVFEGGAVQRDIVDWMRKGHHQPIQNAITQLHDEWSIITFQAYPGMTIMRKR